MERSLLDTFEELKEINCTVWCWKHMLKAGGKGTDARNWNCNEDIQVIFTDKLANESGIGNNLLYRYGDIGDICPFTAQSLRILCQVVNAMRDTKAKEQITRWWLTWNRLREQGLDFRVDFSLDHEKWILSAYFLIDSSRSRWKSEEEGTGHNTAEIRSYSIEWSSGFMVEQSRHRTTWQWHLNIRCMHVGICLFNWM